VFAKLECYSCHEVKGENFPLPTDKSTVGPELSTMGPLHDEGYFAESIINPGAVIEKGKGYAGPDGSSRMPSFNESLTVQDVTDLVAYLRQLRAPAKAPAGRGATSGEHKQH
jgi:cytochrome c1